MSRSSRTGREIPSNRLTGSAVAKVARTDGDEARHVSLGGTDPDDRETVVRLSLDAVGDATRVALSQGEFASRARLALHASGLTDSLVKLRESIEPRA